MFRLSQDLLTCIKRSLNGSLDYALDIHGSNTFITMNQFFWFPELLSINTMIRLIQIYGLHLHGNLLSYFINSFFKLCIELNIAFFNFGFESNLPLRFQHSCK